MGRNKIKIERIKNERIRQVTFYKRKRGLLKKAMELSLLCEVKVLMLIVDKNEKITLYSSETNVKNIISTYLLKHNLNRDVILNNDVNIELFIEGIKNPELTDSKESDEISEEEKIAPPKIRAKRNNPRIREENLSITAEKEVNESMETNTIQQSDISSNNQMHSSIGRFEVGNEQGLSKIKKKLSLKVVIPEDKRKNEVTDSNVKNVLNKPINGNAIVENSVAYDINNSCRNFNNLLQNNNPLSIFSQSLVQNDFVGNKRHIEENENNNNFNHYSPNFSAGSLKAISPFYNPTPNIHTSGVSNYFMFSNNLVGTPIKTANNIPNINFQIYGGVNSNFNTHFIPNTNPLSNSIINNNNVNYEITKNQKECENSQTTNNNLQTHSNYNMSNLNTHPTIISIPKINIKDDQNLNGLPTPGRNLGFYSWVIHGSPVLHNNPLADNLLPQNNKIPKKKKNFRKNEL